MLKSVDKQPEQNAQIKLNEESKLAVTLYTDSAKQIITLSTTIIALITAFAGELITDSVWIVKTLAILSWISLFAAVICGLFVIAAIVGMIDPGSPGTKMMLENGEVPEITVYDLTVRRFSIAQWITFILGLGLTIGILFAAIVAPQHEMTEVELIGKSIKEIERHATVDAYATLLYSKSATPTLSNLTPTLVIPITTITPTSP